MASAVGIGAGVAANAANGAKVSQKSLAQKALDKAGNASNAEYVKKASLFYQKKGRYFLAVRKQFSAQCRIDGVVDSVLGVGPPASIGKPAFAQADFGAIFGIVSPKFTLGLVHKLMMTDCDGKDVESQKSAYFLMMEKVLLVTRSTVDNQHTALDSWDLLTMLCCRPITGLSGMYAHDSLELDVVPKKRRLIEHVNTSAQLCAILMDAQAAGRISPTMIIEEAKSWEPPLQLALYELDLAGILSPKNLGTITPLFNLFRWANLGIADASIMKDYQLACRTLKGPPTLWGRSVAELEGFMAEIEASRAMLRRMVPPKPARTGAPQSKGKKGEAKGEIEGKGPTKAQVQGMSQNAGGVLASLAANTVLGKVKAASSSSFGGGTLLTQDNVGAMGDQAPEEEEDPEEMRTEEDTPSLFGFDDPEENASESAIVAENVKLKTQIDKQASDMAEMKKSIDKLMAALGAPKGPGGGGGQGFGGGHEQKGGSEASSSPHPTQSSPEPPDDGGGLGTGGNSGGGGGVSKIPTPKAKVLLTPPSPKEAATLPDWVTDTLTVELKPEALAAIASALGKIKPSPQLIGVDRKFITVKDKNGWHLQLASEKGVENLEKMQFSMVGNVLKRVS